MIGLAALVTVMLVKSLTTHSSSIKVKLPSISAGKVPSTGILADLKKNILGQQDQIMKEATEASSSLGNKPIAEPVENIQNQTQRLLESVKNLPQDQVDALKKQICKEVCGD